MNQFKSAIKFFRNCESSTGWDACKDYVAENASFMAQSEPFAEVITVKDYVEAMFNLGTTTLKGSHYTIHSSAFDKENQTALIFATYTAIHTGEGGPVPPTNKSTNSHYVFALKMNKEGKVESMTKIWNSSWAFRELGWM